MFNMQSFLEEFYRRRRRIAIIMKEFDKCKSKQNEKENKMSENYFMLDGEKTVMSEETTDSLRKKRDEKKELDFVVAISPGLTSSSSDRIILRLPDEILAEKYEGDVLSLDNKGKVAYRRPKLSYIVGKLYTGNPEQQVFPIIRRS